ncbi:MAG TPA: hypothetical protein VNQ81_13220 [Povalibacter sp.]|nr:hypothetical protein [Povalibacter sp.]
MTTRFAILGLVLGVVAACHAPPEVRPAPPASPLQLLGSDPLQVPETCRAEGSVFVAFTVERNGTTRDIQPAAAPACLQQALTAWVASFRYSSQTGQVPAGIEWLQVEARQGT